MATYDDASAHYDAADVTFEGDAGWEWSDSVLVTTPAAPIKHPEAIWVGIEGQAVWTPKQGVFV